MSIELTGDERARRRGLIAAVPAFVLAATLPVLAVLNPADQPNVAGVVILASVVAAFAALIGWQSLREHRRHAQLIVGRTQLVVEQPAVLRRRLKIDLTQVDRIVFADARSRNPEPEAAMLIEGRAAPNLFISLRHPRRLPLKALLSTGDTVRLGGPTQAIALAVTDLKAAREALSDWRLP